MIASLLEFSLRQRVLILGLAILLSVAGIYAFQVIPIDAFPDVTNILVQVVTKAPRLSPVEVERLVTFPLELQLRGLPGLTDIRSLSKVGLSLITVAFTDDIDIYLARQLVFERVTESRDLLPPETDSMLMPNSTGLGEIYQYYLEGSDDRTVDSPTYARELMERRTIQDWVIRPLLKGVPDVVEVNSMGGFVKQYQVMVEPGLLRKYNLPLREVVGAVARNNANAGGNILERYAEKYIIRGVGLIKSVDDIRKIVVKQVGGTPVYVSDLAEVSIGHAVRHGAVVLNGEREVVAGIVLMLRGGNAQNVVQAVKQKIEEIHRANLLPGGLRIVPFYDRIELIEAALNTVSKALLEGVALVIAVLFLFLGNIRSALIVVTTLLLTPLATFIFMDGLDLTANLMTLGGLAIAIGMIVDGSVVVVENVYRHLLERHGGKADVLDVVRQATQEVGRPVVFGIIIIAVVFLPILSLHGMEGKMFKPLAYTIMMSLLISLVLSLTVSPVLCSLFLRASGKEDTFLLRWTRETYLPVLRWAIHHRLAVMATAVTLLAASLALFPFLGGEFIPILNEGAITPQTIRLPNISLPESIDIEKKVQKAVLKFAEVRLAVSKIGRSELGNDPQEPNASDPVVALHPMETWKTADTKAELDDAVRHEIEKIPGAHFLLSQPIQQRVDELLSGVRSEATAKILGDDLNVLRATAEKIETILHSVKGVKDVRIEELFGQIYLTVDIDRGKIARHGINVADVQEIIRTAIGGDPATRVYEGPRRFDLILRFPEQHRDSVETIRNILLRTASGALIPLGELASVELREGPALVSRENLKRRIYVGFNTKGRDIESIVAEAQRKIHKLIQLQPGYTITWGGSFENMERAMKRLRIIVPVTIGLIFLLLFSSFNSVRYAALIIMNLPFALIGGIVALWMTGEYVSVPASIGFINLFGVAVLNGIVLVSYINKLRGDGMEAEQAIVKGCTLRLRPVLMTALVAMLGLLPLAFATGIGAEVQRPLATVVIGGLFTSTALTLVVLPALYGWMAEKETGKEHAPEWV
ncbi:MAG TPA: CusA/CzcA family heavy metal efflux RND transporter [Nitrospira sp.]|nr:CusA/CzcA family heavy metal efflux RND transporter [Nitrospira sp.]